MYKPSELMESANSLQKAAVLCFIAGKFMMPFTVFARFTFGETAGNACLGGYAALIAACAIICLYERYYYVPFVEGKQIEILEKRLAKLKRKNNLLKTN